MTETTPTITAEKCAPGRKEHEPTLGVVTWAEWYRTPTRNIRVECMAGDCPAGELIEAGHPVIHEALDLVASLSGIIEYGDDAELSLADLRLMSPIHVARVAWAMAKAITEHSAHSDQLIVDLTRALAETRAALRKGVALAGRVIESGALDMWPSIMDNLDNWQADVQVDLL